MFSKQIYKNKCDFFKSAQSETSEFCAKDTETTNMTEFWEKTKSLECFSTEDRGVEYFEDHLYTRCNGGIRSVKKSSNEIVGRADCEEDPISCSKIDLGKQYIDLCL